MKRTTTNGIFTQGRPGSPSISKPGSRDDAQRTGGEQSKEATTPDARIGADGRNVCIAHRLEADYQERGTTCATCDELPDARGSRGNSRRCLLLHSARLELWKDAAADTMKGDAEGKHWSALEHCAARRLSLHASVAHGGNKHSSSTSDRRIRHKSHAVYVWEQEENHNTLSCRLLGESRKVSRRGRLGTGDTTPGRRERAHDGQQARSRGSSGAVEPAQWWRTGRGSDGAVAFVDDARVVDLENT